MNKTIISAVAVAVAVALFATCASAATISASDIASGSASGIDFTATGGSLATKTTNGVTGVGVTGGNSGNEIDLDTNGSQKITATSNGFILGSLTLALLYDGPEYGDVQEVAQIMATYAGGTSTAKLTNIYTGANDTDVILFIDGMQRNDLVLNASQATSDIGSEITLGQLFGNNVLTGLEFSALPGVCGDQNAGAGACNNQSDYGIESLTTVDNANDVPEPGAFGLAALAFALIGFGARRRMLNA